MKKILTFPGAFSPPHLGHVSTLEVVLNQESFDEVWIIPSGKRDDKSISLTYEERRNLGNIFIEHLRSKFHLPIILRTDELDNKDGKSTTEILNGINSLPGFNITQLIGLDGMIRLQKYVGGSNKFIVVKRQGYEESDLLPHGDNIRIIGETTKDISSTQIRKMIKNSEVSYKKLLPVGIANYIEEHNLYI
jgi:nicotinate (nicotinamide) nucleotide adenylyltransferase